MNHSLRLAQKTVQTLSLTPQLIQTLKYLQMPAEELAEQIQHELAENPFLEGREKTEEPPFTDSENLDEKRHQEEYLDYTANPPGQQTSSSDIIEKTAYRGKSLTEFLREQLCLEYPENSQEYEIGMYIIGSLTEQGYFPHKSRELLLTQSGFPQDKCQAVCKLIADFDPPGVAAPDLKTSLLKQLQQYEPDQKQKLAQELIEKCFDALTKITPEEAAKKLQVSRSSAKEALDLISFLDPYPSRSFDTEEINLVTPEINVKRIGDEFQIYIHEELFPELSFSKNYHRYLQEAKGSEAEIYLKEQAEKAKTMIDSLAYRKTNLQKAAAKLLEVQRDFFISGPQYLKPYTLVRFAEELGINQGTMSRIINSKYIDTEWGIFSLKVFFSSRVEGTQKSYAANAVKEVMQEIIKEYDGEKKLSDQMLVDAMEKQGIKIARRTVAKYRNQLQILSSIHRK